jgi:sulfide:quinone oxidoreductase
VGGTTTLVLGGGFAGIAAANALRGALPAEHEVVVIDETQRFHVGAGKTWIMLGTRSYEQVSQARAALLAIVIPKTPFKCPPAPCEAAMLLREAFERRGLGDKVRIAIHSVEGAPMMTAGPEMGQYIKGELAQRGIGFFALRAIARVEAAARRIEFQDGSVARYDLLLAVPPHVAPKAVRDAGLVNASGWIPVDAKTMQVKQPATANDVYAAGDVTVVPLPGRYKPEVGLTLPKAGVFAEAHGRVAARQIAAKVLGRAPEGAFDGKGFCFLETGARQAVKADGSFFELPHPVMSKRIADEAQLAEKMGWVDAILRPVR